ncbi:MAG: D-alanine--D-alanine ligase [Verrucomicrobiales bacterium]|nr:D-alanine--D-alanine ligase [Verrucomicrobiales bacterium]
MNRPLHIVVLRGGPSAEREVSLRSGAAVARALASLGHRVTEFDPVPCSPLPHRPPAPVDVAFLALHGTYGEDGTVQSELEQLGVPYTGCDVEASRVAFDKVLTKQRLVARDVPTPRFLVASDPATPFPPNWRPPLVLKPVRQGSSVGLEFLEDAAQWPAALASCLRYDREALIEERILGREVTVGILEHTALPLVEVRPHAGAYDYRNKYTPGATEYLCPAPFDDPTTRRIQAAALAAFEAVEGRDYARVDVMVRPDGTPLVLEVNTLPGMTETSLLPKAAAAAGIGFAELCQSMVDLARRRTPRHPTSPASHVA